MEGLRRATEPPTWISLEQVFRASLGDIVSLPPLPLEYGIPIISASTTAIVERKWQVSTTNSGGNDGRRRAGVTGRARLKTPIIDRWPRLGPRTHLYGFQYNTM